MARTAAVVMELQHAFSLNVACWVVQQQQLRWHVGTTCGELKLYFSPSAGGYEKKSTVLRYGSSRHRFSFLDRFFALPVAPHVHTSMFFGQLASNAHLG